MLQVMNPLSSGMQNPIGITHNHVKLSWYIDSDMRDTMQTAFQVIAADTLDDVLAEKGSFYDSGVINSKDTLCELGRPIYESGKRIYWSVRAWDNHGEVSAWCKAQWFETGLLYTSDWKAKWIEPKQRPMHQFFPSNLMDQKTVPAVHEEAPEGELNPCPIIRKVLNLEKTVRKARLYATAHGVYQASINGKRVGDLEMMPEATPYHKMLQVQTYDVTGMLQDGENVVGMTLGDGWWSGRVSSIGNPCVYGNTLACIWQMNLEYEDGTTEQFGSDDSCVSYFGAIQYSDIGIGEKIDMRKALAGWDLPGLWTGTWSPVDIKDYGYENFCGQNAEPAKVVRVISPVSFKEYEDGSILIDFGQIIAGNCKVLFDGTGRRGEEILLSYCEQTDKNGDFIYNFSCYRQHEDIFILAGNQEEVYEPKFSWRGFRWLRIKGYSGTMDMKKVEARLIASDVKQVSSMTCSDPRITKLQENIQWTLINNLLSVPTDNPDRERVGWTGDFQEIAATMFYNFKVDTFVERWFAEHRLEQFDNGRLPMFIPYQAIVDLGISCGWGDEVIIAPWEAYQAYGDSKVLEDNYEMMQRWMDYVVRRMQMEPSADQNGKNPENPMACNMDMRLYKNWNPDMSDEVREHFQYIWDADFHFGDWMVPSGNVDENGNWIYDSRHNCETFIPCFYTAYSSALMADIARILHKENDEKYYANLNEKIRTAVIAEMYDTGYIPENTFQGVLTLALKAGLYPEGKKKVLQDQLVNAIYNVNDGKLNTGFSSTEHIMFELVAAGHIQTAFDLLFNEKVPSYIYMIDHDATGIWETWTNIGEDGTVNQASYTQYAIGNIGKWLMSAIGGISQLEPGYRKIRIAPVIDPKRRITYANADYETPHGIIKTSWSVEENTVTLKVKIPANTTAVVEFIGSDKLNDNIGSGTYEYVYELRPELT